MTRGKSTLAYKKKENPNYHTTSRTRIYNESIQLYLSIYLLHLHPPTDTESEPTGLLYTPFSFLFSSSFSIVTRVKHDLEGKQSDSRFSFDPTDRITEFTINRKRYRISSLIKINNDRARISAR